MVAMSARLEKHIDYLKVLNKTNPKTRSAILQNADKELLLCICECVENILNGNVRLTPKQQNELKKYAKALRQLRDKGTKLQKKKKLLVQKGGFLAALLLTPIIAGLASAFIK